MSPSEQKLPRSYFRQARRSIERGDRDAAIEYFGIGGAVAEQTGDIERVLRAGAQLEKLGAFADAWRLLATGGRLQSRPALPEWDGTDQPGRTLLVVQRIRDIAAPIRLARLIPLAARGMRRCIVLAEPRLVPLFQRSFDGVDVRPDTDSEAAWSEADMVASYETLSHHLASDAEQILHGFAPLRPEPAQVATFRARYAVPSGAPRIGLSWASISTAKELPAIADWAAFMRTFDATFVSLQYGDTSLDRDALRAASGREVIQDPAVDQLLDLDSFAAQTAALDAVVTISNTTAHMAGALGVPTMVVLGDKIPSMWPLTGECPWYPRTTLLRKAGRRWSDVFADVRDSLDRCLASVRA